MHVCEFIYLYIMREGKGGRRAIEARPHSTPGESQSTGKSLVLTIMQLYNFTA